MTTPLPELERGKQPLKIFTIETWMNRQAYIDYYGCTIKFADNAVELLEMSIPMLMWRMGRVLNALSEEKQ